MAKIFAGRIPPARLANTTYITARQSFPMAAHIKSMPFLPMDWKSLITYPPELFGQGDATSSFNHSRSHSHQL
jgi:hypothetical protein